MEEDKAYLTTIPWCAKLLADPALTLTEFDSRNLKADAENAFFAQTLKTGATIQACLSFYRAPESASEELVPRLDTLVALGEGLNGYPGVTHGGVVASLLDECMGHLMVVNGDRRRRMRMTAAAPAAAPAPAPVSGPTVTAYLNVTYLKAVATAQTVLVSAAFKEIAGRKRFIEATLQDGDGIVLAKGDALFVEVKKSEENL